MSTSLVSTGRHYVYRINITDEASFKELVKDAPDLDKRVVVNFASSLLPFSSFFLGTGTLRMSGQA